MISIQTQLATGARPGGYPEVLCQQGRRRRLNFTQSIDHGSFGPEGSVSMLRTVKAVIDQQGNVRLLEPLTLPEPRHALVTILEETPAIPPTVSQPSPQTRVGDWRTHYRPVRRIGQGGMGETYLAVDVLTGKAVCVKSLLPTIDPRALLQECRALAKLQHPCIVKVLNFDTQQDSPYLVVEFVQGLTLADYYRSQQALLEPVVVDLGKHLFDAVAYAHEHDVLHCDLKPSNILLTRQGTTLLPRIVDFGLAVVDRRDDQDALTAFGRCAGTPAYMAPEQCQGHQLSGACDVYALGLILWEGVMGRRAFVGSPTAIVYEKSRQTTGLRIDDPPWAVSASLARLIEACTHPDPTQRPTSYQALEALNESEPRVAAPAVVTAMNLGFDWADGRGTPAGWFNSHGYVDGISTAYDFIVVPRPDGTRGSCAQIRREKASGKEFGSLMQRFPGHCLRGRELRLEGEICTQDVRGWAGLWLRIDRAAGALYFDNMHDRPVRGSCNWTACALSTRLPKETAWINYGVLLVGGGTVWADNLRLLVQNREDVFLPLGLWNEETQQSPDIPTT
jgi:serine/threonine protein kinase